MVAIALVVASKYFFAGVVLALWSVFMALIWPIVKGIHYVIGHPEIDRQRGRAASITFGAIATVLLLGSYAPLPSWTIAEGVVWLPANAEVRTGTSGFVSRIVARPGAYVKAGAPLLELSDDEAAAEVQVHLAKKQQLAVQLGSEMFDNRLKAELTKQSLESEMAILARLDAKQDELVCFAGRAGNWTLLNGEDALGRYLAQGALVGYVLSDNARTVRVVVAQDDVDQVRVHAKRISLRPVDRPWLTISAKSAREVPGGSERLPSKALSLDGGGRIATDPRDSSGLKTLGRTFQFDLELDGDASDLVFGSRVYVRFDHDDLPLFVQIYRAVRQVILAKLAF
jgi:putative peptide zinc metalloprotease protein